MTTASTPAVATAAFIVAALLFIRALAGLSHHESAKAGNYFGIAGMVVALAVFSVAAAVAFHSNFADQNQMIHFLKNVMMAGGLLQIAAFGAGAISIEQYRRKSETPSAGAAMTA